jgi:hypothetical protein
MAELASAVGQLMVKSPLELVWSLEKSSTSTARFAVPAVVEEL